MDADAKTSPERALEVLRRIQHHQVRLNEKTSMLGISSITQEQTDLFKALNVKKPASTHSQNICGGAFLPIPQLNHRLSCLTVEVRQASYTAPDRVSSRPSALCTGVKDSGRLMC